MSESQADTDDTRILSAEDVLTYLRANPHFLQQNPEACDFLLPPKAVEKSRKVTDFQAYMIERLKADKREVLESTRELVETARNNMSNQSRIHRAILRLLEAESFEEFVQVITIDLAPILNVDISALIVEAEGNHIPHISTTGVKIVPEGTLDRWMEGRPAQLHANITGHEAIYGAGATLVRSQALVRVDISGNTPPAMLAFGSRDPHMFENGQATDLVSFLARVIERTFRAWLHIPQS